MILNALISCGYLVLGSGYAVYRLINHSNVKFSRVLPQFACASIGIASISARSIQNITYHLVWRRYPLDPILAENEKYNKCNNYFVTWGLKTLGFSLIFRAFCLHYNFSTTGTIVLTILVTSEIIHFLKKTLSIRFFIGHCISTTSNYRLVSFLKSNFTPYFWIFSTECLGLIVGNSYIRLANIPFSFAALTYRPKEFNHEWSLRCAMNDFMMLAYIIFITEAFCQS